VLLEEIKKREKRRAHKMKIHSRRVLTVINTLLKNIEKN